MALKQQLQGLLDSMFEEGLLDEQFHQVQLLEDASNPGFVAEAITLYGKESESERMLAELKRLLDQAVVDYQKVDTYVQILRGCSSGMGARKVNMGCIRLRQFCEGNDREGCQSVLNIVQHDNNYLRNKFQTLVQLEQRIQAYDAKQEN